MTSLYMYFTLTIVLVELSVCHETIFVLINVFVLLLSACCVLFWS